MSAEPAVATSAPEHDAQEDAPSNPTLSEHCTTDRPTPAGEAPKGEVRKLGGVDVYLAKPDSYPSDPCKLLLLLTGGTGLESQNNQIQADKFAAEGFVVIMPDLFEGDPAPNQSAKLPEPGNVEGQTQDEIAGSFLEQFKAKIGETAKSFLIDMWLARHTEEKVMPILEKVIQAAKGEFADAIGHGGGIYGVGYCFGGRYILLLASERAANQTGWTGAQKPADEEAGDNKSGPLIKAGALAHATLVSQEDFNGLKSPISLVCVENDPMFPDEVRTLGEDTMNKTGVEHEVQVYPGVPHGFAVYGDYEEAHIKEAQSTAHEQMLKWILEN